MYSCVCICSYLWKCLLIHISVFPHLLSVFLWMYIHAYVSVSTCKYINRWKYVLSVSGDVMHMQAAGVDTCSFSPPGTHSPSMALGNTPSTMIKMPLSLKMPICSGPRYEHLAQAPGSPLRTGILNRKIIKAEIHPIGRALKNSLRLLQPGSPKCRPQGILSGPQK